MQTSKANSVWKLLLFLIFLRPFICQRCFPRLDIYYSLAFLCCSLIWLRLNAQASRKSRLDYAILLFWVAIAISTLFSFYRLLSLWESYKFIPYLAVFYGINKASAGQKKELLSTLVGAACLLSLYAIYQFCWGFQNILDYIRQTGPYPYAQEFLARKRAFATFLSPDMFAGYLIMIIPLAVALFLDSLRKKNRLLSISVGSSAILMLVALVLTKSIGGWISFFVASLIFFGLFFTFQPQARGKILLALLISCAIIISILSWIFFMRTDYLAAYAHPQNSLTQRFYFWKSAVKIIQDFPFQGVGLGNFGLVYLRYKSPQAFQTHFAHNSYLQIWVEMGILGIAAWLWLIFSSLKTGLRNIKVAGGQYYLRVGLMAASGAFLIHNLIDFDFFIPEVAFQWWVILGMISFWPENKAENSSFS